jgi:hypothetical protein
VLGIFRKRNFQERNYVLLDPSVLLYAPGNISGVTAVANTTSGMGALTKLIFGGDKWHDGQDWIPSLWHWRWGWPRLTSATRAFKLPVPSLSLPG